MRAFLWFGIFLMASCGVVNLEACSAGAKVAEATYTADLLKCVDDSKSRAEADACKEKVRVRWHVDGGPQ